MLTDEQIGEIADAHIIHTRGAIILAIREALRLAEQNAAGQVKSSAATNNGVAEPEPKPESAPAAPDDMPPEPNKLKLRNGFTVRLDGSNEPTYGYYIYEDAYDALRAYAVRMRDENTEFRKHLGDAHAARAIAECRADAADVARCEIERLAANEHDKRVRYENFGMMNTPSEPEARKAAAVEYALARREMIEAKRALEDALNA